MILDANQGLVAPESPYDCCIIGSGPAGITLALKLSEKGMRVVILEAGGRDYSPDSQEVYEGENIGLDYFPLDSPRLRYLGGTSGHWTGRCMLLDASDFDPRDEIPLSGWPIRQSDIKPYQSEAAGIIGAPDFGQIRRPADGSTTLDIVTQHFSSDRKFHDLRDHEPRRFGTYFFEKLKKSTLITVVLNANVTDLDVNSETGEIIRAVFRNYDDQIYSIPAKSFTLAMGALENARFLLHFNRKNRDLFGNQGDMVGRCFMEHLYLQQGRYFITRRLYSHSKYWEFDRLIHRTVPQLVLSPSPDYARKAGILNGTIKLDRLRQTPLSEAQSGSSDFLNSLEFGEDYFFTGSNYVVGEQSPNPKSRVTLTTDRDKFGMYKIGLDLQLLPIDIETIRHVAIKGAEYLIQTGLGRMQIEPNLWNRMPVEDIPLNYGSHHMGGTRMSTSAQTGVVDADCKVHGAKNLFVAGSGVFATSGFANPTFTIVQLSLRLAEFIKKSFG